MSPKTKKFHDLTAPLYANPKRRARIEAETQAILTGLRLAELRTEQGLTQVQLAERLGTTQENVSRIERAEDTQLSTIRRYIEALGGSLELHAVFASVTAHAFVGELVITDVAPVLNYARSMGAWVADTSVSDSVHPSAARSRAV